LKPAEKNNASGKYSKQRYLLRKTQEQEKSKTIDSEGRIASIAYPPSFSFLATKRKLKASFASKPFLG
jgi:rRNA maturation protein Nop10